MPNPFLDESRGEYLSIDLEGFVHKLRCPETIKRLVAAHKPDTESQQAFVLISTVQSILTQLIMGRDFRTVRDLLVTWFGPGVTTVTPAARNGSAAA